MTGIREEFELGGHALQFEVGELARQADASVTARQGRAMILVTVVIGREDAAQRDFVPLLVDYRERAAANGKIPSTYDRREGRVTEEEILTSRLIDRALRPSFPSGFARDVVISAQVISGDPRVDLPILALLGASAACALASLPLTGVVGAVRVVRGSDGCPVVHPATELARSSRVDTVLAATELGYVMVDATGDRIPEEDLTELLAAGQIALQPWRDCVDRLVRAVGAAQASKAHPVEEEGGIAALTAEERAAVRATQRPGKRARRDGLARVADAVSARLGTTGQLDRRALALVDDELRRAILDDGVRPDGRSVDEVRPLELRIGYLPSTHGSAVFQRGETQVLASATLGSRRSEQMVESAGVAEPRRFFLHYAFPPYSVGEVRPSRGPARREIGHGALAQRAFRAVLPDFETFPYVVRVEADVTESNGSSSMATVCAASLALVDAGVPLADLVAGVAMGLVVEGARTAILTDILGDEDQIGSMDLKVAGTADGITALQMDTSSRGVDPMVFSNALMGARAARRQILDAMRAAIDQPRADLPREAPRLLRLRIPSDAVGLLIGPKGATIRGFQDEFGVEIQVGDDGRVSIFAPNAAAAESARHRISDLVGTVVRGGLYRGRVTSVKDYGAFVRIFETAEGLVHISEWAEERVPRIEDVARPGDEVLVRVLGGDGKGRLSLSRKAAVPRDGEKVLN